MSGSSDRIEDLGPIKEQLKAEGVDVEQSELDRMARQVALKKGRKIAKADSTNKGGVCVCVCVCKCMYGCTCVCVVPTMLKLYSILLLHLQLKPVKFTSTVRK